MEQTANILSKDTWYILESVLGVVRWPEAVAAIALVIQAFILWQHRRILSGYGETLERHAETAKLIGHSLEQHGRILADHTRIMDEMLKFQRRNEAKIDLPAPSTAHSDDDPSLVSLSK